MSVQIAVRLGERDDHVVTAGCDARDIGEEVRLVGGYLRVALHVEGVDDVSGRERVAVGELHTRADGVDVLGGRHCFPRGCERRNERVVRREGEQPLIHQRHDRRAVRRVEVGRVPQRTRVGRLAPSQNRPAVLLGTRLRRWQLRSGSLRRAPARRRRRPHASVVLSCRPRRQPRRQRFRVFDPLSFPPLCSH